MSLSPKRLKVPVQSIDEQRELFLWKFRDIDRAAIMVQFEVSNLM
jgi:hypothetical protein